MAFFEHVLRGVLYHPPYYSTSQYSVNTLSIVNCVVKHLLYYSLGKMAKNVLPHFSDISGDRKTKLSEIIDLYGSF